ncbi:MAG: GPR endopeptidase [Oscillospiraceae bacterium]|jgi:spore protease|nr:GPR endopeptidase [Oscillospiraceae bacterium]MCI9392708.1 GPR endopeptidase [Oscillospiraceae bacterium]
MLTIRTDLAAEARDLWRESAGETTRLPGVRARDEEAQGLPVARVEILDAEGERALGKPPGVYLTLDVAALWRREEGIFARVVRAMAELLGPLLPEGPVLAAGLGNPAMTPDALGPRTLDHLLITRHLQEVLPGFRPVAGLGAGVLGTTGLEVAEWVRGAAEHVKPAAVVLIDALAARGLDRLCSTVQLSDTGLIPGSGVGNHRMALNRETLGVPVLSVGVPTVVDAETVARDLLADSGAEEAPLLAGRGRRLFVTPDSIDAKIRELAKVVGYGLNLALQPDLEIEDLDALLA